MWWGDENNEAEVACREAVKLFGELEVDRPGDIDTRSNLAGNLWNLGVILGRQQINHTELDAIYDRSLRLFEGLVRDFPQDISYRDGLATLHSKLAGLAQGRNGRHAESEQRYREALETFEHCMSVVRRPEV